MSLSEPSSPRSARLLRQAKTLKATTDELARLWQKEVQKLGADDDKKIKDDSAESDQFDNFSLRLPKARMSLLSDKASSLSSFVLDLSGSRSSMSSSVLSDLTDILVMPKANDKGKKSRSPRLKRSNSARALTCMKYASTTTKKKAEGAKLSTFFGVSEEEVEFSDKYRKLIRTFGNDFPDHAAVLGMIADKKQMRDYEIHRKPAELYNDTEASEDQIRQRKKLESFAGLTEEDYGNFKLQLKLYQKLGEQVPLEVLHKKHRSASLPPELEALDPNASKLERFLGVKKEVIVGQDKAKKAARILGEQLPQDYCEELAKLENAPEKINLHSRKISQPVTKEEVKQAAKGTGGLFKKKLKKSPSKKVVGKKASPTKKEREGGGGGLSIMGTAFKKPGLSPLKGVKTGKPLRN